MKIKDTLRIRITMLVYLHLQKFLTSIHVSVPCPFLISTS